MRMNHDCQYLFTQIHALAIIYYTMKYISKAEENAHSKLTIAATVARALATSKRDGRDEGKSMLIKTYNRLSSHREVGIPEALSHLLDYPNALTDAIFQSVHTTHLLNHSRSGCRPCFPTHNEIAFSQAVTATEEIVAKDYESMMSL